MENLIILSHATYGATAAATYSFMTSDYKPPVQPRYIESDIVKNQNGIFKWLYDNGPGLKRWQPFKVHCEQAWATQVGATAGMQKDRLEALWNHPGLLKMEAPDGVHNVHWAGDKELAFRIFPTKASTPLEWTIVVQFEEGTT